MALVLDQNGRPVRRAVGRDAYSDDRIDRIVGSSTLMPTKDAESIAMEARARVAESAAATSLFREERRVCREFMRSHYTEDELDSRGDRASGAADSRH